MRGHRGSEDSASVSLSFFLLLLMYNESDFTSTDTGIKFITKS